MIEKIEHRGVLIRECTLPGETRADDVFPAQGNAIRVSRERWLIVYATRGYRGVDDDRSIVYQLREKSPAGPLIKEGGLALAHDTWEPFGDGQKFFKEHGHPVAFGVPAGARIRGRPAPNANLFVAKWRILAKLVKDGRSIHPEPDILQRTQGVEWVQFRLDDSGDDIEIVQPAGPLRQKGYERSDRFCDAPVKTMNQAFVQAVPCNDACTEWADCNHFDGGRIAALKYRYNPERGLYEWVEIGPLISDPPHSLCEASLVRLRDGWAILARTDNEMKGIAWVRSEDPFRRVARPVYPGDIENNAPVTAYLCPDGVLRLFGGDVAASPHRNGRDPLYCWDVDPASFRSFNRRVVLDSVAAGLPIRPESGPRVDMCKLVPHAGGREQFLLHRVRVKSIAHPYTRVIINETEKALSAIYHAVITYEESYPPTWEFEDPKSPPAERTATQA